MAKVGDALGERWRWGKKTDEESAEVKARRWNRKVNRERRGEELEGWADSRSVLALVEGRGGQLAWRSVEVGDGLGWEFTPLSADDLSILNTILGEGEVSVRSQHPDVR